MSTQGEVDWREEYRSLKEKIRYIFASALFSNISFTVSDGQNMKKFRGHSVFLTMASPVFERMFEGGFKESSLHINIDDVNPDIFQSFLESVTKKFIYFDSVDLKTFHQACELYKIGHKYLVIPLQEYCLSYIRQNLNVGTACIGFELADVYDLTDIKRACKQIILSNTPEVLSHPVFLSVKERTIQALLQETDLNISEITLFKYVEGWIKTELLKRGAVQDEEMKKSLCESIIPKFHFFDMTLKEFTDGPCKSGLLSVEQKLAVFENMASEDACPLPDGFTKKRRRQSDRCERDFIALASVDLAAFVKPIIDFLKHRYIYFTVNCDITIKALKFSTKESLIDMGQKYKDELGVKLWEVRKDCESVTEVRREMEYNSSEIVVLSWPVRVAAGQKYTLVMWTKGGGDYKSLLLDKEVITSGGVKFSFLEDPSSPPILPLLAIYYTK